MANVARAALEQIQKKLEAHARGSLDDPSIQGATMMLQTIRGLVLDGLSASAGESAPPAPGSVPGHNQPPPTSPADDPETRERVEALARTCNRWLTERPVLDAASAPTAQDYDDQVAKELKALDEARLAEKRPHLDANTAIDEKFKPLLAALTKVRELFAPKLRAFKLAEERRLKLEQEAAEKEAERLRQEAEVAKQAAQQAVEAPAPGADVVGAALQAEELERQARAAEKVAAAPPARPIIRGDLGGRGKGLRTVWRFELQDFAKVPDKWKILNEVAINQAIRSGDHPVRRIAGLRIYPERV